MSFIGKIITPTFKRKIRNFLSFRYKGKIKKDFSILSNNCWGGIQYDRLGKRYTSPTIGVLIPPEGYITLLEQLDEYCKFECTLDNKLQRKDGKHIGLYKANLKDISFFFIHYCSGEDGMAKWNKRRKRIVFDNIIVKWSDCPIDKEEITEDQIIRFSKLPFKKIFFTTNKELAERFDFAVLIKTKDNRPNFLQPSFEFDSTKNAIKINN